MNMNKNHHCLCALGAIINFLWPCLYGMDSDGRRRKERSNKMSHLGKKETMAIGRVGYENNWLINFAGILVRSTKLFLYINK